MLCNGREKKVFSCVAFVISSTIDSYSELMISFRFSPFFSLISSSNKESFFILFEREQEDPKFRFSLDI